MEKGTTETTGTSERCPFRVIVSTDIPPLDVIAGKGANPGDPPERVSDPDDVQSMIRFLLYSNEFDVEALIASAGTFANIARKQNILDLLDLYEAVHPNLTKHDSGYPSADELRARTWQGMDGTIGTEAFGDGKYRPIESLLGDEHDTEASEAIIAMLDRPDPRPVWVCVWGGSREVAQAIWKIRRTRGSEEFEQILAKLRIYLIVKQDYTADWLLGSFADLFIILSERNYRGMFWNADGFRTELADLEWVERNIRYDHGPLGAAYPRSGWDPYSPGVCEGDTPSYLHLVSAMRGVNDPERPDQGGWGGKFIQPNPTRNHWFDDPMGTRAVSMWRAEYQDEFRIRASWMKS